MSNTGKPSAVELVKGASSQLRGTIAEALTATATHFSDADAQLLKFHGTYQQYDRDNATERKRQGLEKAHQFMVRAAIPAGVLNAEQYLALDTLGRQYADGSLRVSRAGTCAARSPRRWTPTARRSAQRTVSSRAFG